MSTQSEELVFIVDETHEDRVCDKKTALCQNEAILNIEWVCATCSSELKMAYCLTHEAVFFSNMKGTPFPDGQRHATCQACKGRYPDGLGAKRVYPVERS